MIIHTKYSIFSVKDAYLVNTVNNEGVMGKGLALEVKLRCPETFKFYEQNYKGKKGGDLLLDKPNKYIHFFTKESWKGNSKIEWISRGLLALKEMIKEEQIKTIAIPLLGASNGKLNYEHVVKQIETILKDVDANIYICSAQETDPEEKKIIEAIKADVNKSSTLLYKILTQKQIEEIQEAFINNLIKLFRDFVQFVGPKKYSQLISYSNVINQTNEQSSIFD